MKTDFSSMKPRAIEAYFRDLILRTFGDKVENSAQITSSHGFYNIDFWPGEAHYHFSFRKSTAPRIAKAIRALKNGKSKGE